MKKLKLVRSNGKILLFFCLIVVFAYGTYAQELVDYQDKYLNDYAYIFTPEDAESLRNLLIAIEQETTAEVVVVTLENTGSYTPAEYRTRLFNEWHIGKEDKDNGLLILYSVRDVRIEVETGYGLEGILPDSKLGRLLDENYVPYRDQEQVDKGILAFTIEVAKVLNENKEDLISERKDLPDIWFIVFIIIFILIVILIIRHSIAHPTKHRGTWHYSGGGWSGGGSSSSGGFGGGSSGGGGAGR